MILNTVIGMMGGSLILDIYSGAEFSFSFRKLRYSFSGPCIRVRRFSDNSQLDIGFTNGVLDIASLMSFAGTSSCSLVTWYDQSINARNFSQAGSIINQPRIVLSGVLNTVNGKPAITTGSGGAGVMDFSPGSSSSTPLCVFSVVKRNASSSQSAHIRNASGNAYTTIHDSDNRFYSKSASDTITSTGTDASSNQALLSTMFVAAFKRQYKNGSIIASTSGSGSGGLFSRLIIGDAGNAQEFISFNLDKSATQTLIEANINTFYTIY